MTSDIDCSIEAIKARTDALLLRMNQKAWVNGERRVIQGEGHNGWADPEPSTDPLIQRLNEGMVLLDALMAPPPRSRSHLRLVSGGD